MKKQKFKYLLLGALVGVVISSIIPVVAEQVYNIMINPFRIVINGAEKPIEGYNINGYSYFKLRDIGEQVGFSVDFKEDTIMIETENQDSNEVKDVASTDINNISTSDKMKYISDDTGEIDGEIYYYFQHINQKLLKNIVLIPKWINDKEYILVAHKRDDNEIVIADIPYIMSCEHAYISETYLNEILLPLDK